LSTRYDVVYVKSHDFSVFDDRVPENLFSLHALLDMSQGLFWEKDYTFLFITCPTFIWYISSWTSFIWRSFIPPLFFLQSEYLYFSAH